MDSRCAGKMSKRAAEVQLTADTVEVDEEEEVRDLHACTTTCKLHTLDVCEKAFLWSALFRICPI